jgi:transcription factor IIIB subunit 2
MLDVAKALDIDVYKLGATYVDIKRKLFLDIPGYDPSLFVKRYASMMDLGNAQYKVCCTALKILKTSEGIWIGKGYIPAGIYAAALLVAARCHSFKLTLMRMSEITGVAVITIRYRIAQLREDPVLSELPTKDGDAEAPHWAFQPITQENPAVPSNSDSVP